MDDDDTSNIEILDLDDIGGIQEVAEALDVGIFRARRWVERRHITGCPAPLKQLKMGPIYSISHWRGWFALWRVTRGSETWNRAGRAGGNAG